MPIKRSLRWRREGHKNRRVRRANYHALRDPRVGSPFVRGMARAVDAGGFVRETDVESALKIRRLITSTLKRSNVDAVFIGRDLDVVGQDFQRAVGSDSGEDVLTEASHG